MIRHAAPFLLALLAVAAPSVASAQIGSVLDDRLVLVGGGLFGGEARFRTSTDTAAGEIETDDSTDLDRSGHVGLQFESPIAQYFVLAYRFSAARYEIDDAIVRKRTWFDFGIAPTAAMVFTAGPLAIEPRLGMPLGFSLHHWNADDPDSDDISRNNPGFHIGVLGGVHLGAARARGFASRLGGLIEIGMIHHSGFARYDGSDTRFRLSMNQFVLQVGLSLAL